MDVVQGDFAFDMRSGAVKSSVARNGFLDPELANEGEKVRDRIILSDGEQVSWTPPQVKPVMPDWSEIKSLAKYFNRTGYQTWPCWFYHPSEEPVLIKDAEEAFTRFGIRRRKATDRERALQGAGEWVWETPPECLWQPAPFKGNIPGKFDPAKGEQGKNYVPKEPNPQIAQHALIEQLVTAMQGGQNDFLLKLLGAMGGAAAAVAPSVSADVDAAELEEFRQFQAFKRSQTAAFAAPAGDFPGLDEAAARAAGAIDDEKAAWIAKAKEAGIKVDGRWSAEKMRDHIMAELEKRLSEAEAGASAGEAA